MGVVKDGTVSGLLPTSEAFAVHYPGYPSTTSRAYETLGGIEGIVNARSSQTLELRFRPEDPYSHPVIGRLQSCSNFLLKLSKKTCSVRNTVDASGGSPSTDSVQCDKASSSGPQVGQTEIIGNYQDRGDDEIKTEICADIVAHISEAYCFDGMADYQHVLAVHADAAQRKKRKWADMEPQLQKSGIFDLDQNDLLMLLPPYFSAKDTPEQVVLKSSSKGKKPDELVQHFSHQNFLDIQQRHFFVDFSVEDVPKVIEWEKFTARNSYQRECQMALCKLFDERPVWPKLSVAECLRDNGFKIQHNLLRRLLFNAAYYFLNGPFRRFWIRRGYDPRKDPGTCIYQRIDFRVPPSLRGYCDANAEMKYEQKWADLCAFKCFPYGCQISLQLCELDDDYIQQEIRKPVKVSTCSRTAGWFSVPMINNLRRKIAVRFLSVCPDPEAENLLKTCRNMFERTKMNLIKGDLRPDKSLDKQVHKEIMVDEETEENQQATKEVLPDEEADDYELDDDEDDEEYGEAIGGISGEEDEIPLQPGTYENISANYLRNIFGTFPSDEPGSSKVPLIDASDEEYQIYEPSSDDDVDSDNM
ncbi:unnamed protein product [Rhodiola kirilowii]